MDRDDFLERLEELLADGTGSAHELQGLLVALSRCCPALDMGIVLAAEDGALAPTASLGPVPGAGVGLGADPRALPGARWSLRFSLHGRGGAELGALLVGSSTSAAAGPAERVAARVTAERLAHLVEADRLAGAIARSEEVARQTAGYRDHVLAIVGHDLRNPLGAVVMSAGLLQRKGGLGGWQIKAVDRMRSSAQRMGRIIEDLLSYTRTRLGPGIPIAPRPSDLAELARKTVDELLVGRPDATIDVDVQGDARGEWDPDRLEQVLSNLVSNALDHGEDGHPVHVVLRAQPEEVLLDVTSDGEVPADALQHAFEAFRRGSDETGRKASGLGLGLYIAREIVRRHGGEIAIRSEGGKTRIAARLPRRSRVGTGAAPAG